MTVAVRGRCECGMRFIACSVKTYNDLVRTHVRARHDGEPADRPLVERLQ